MKKYGLVLLGAASVLTLSSCGRDGELEIGAGVGVSVTRSGCPTVAVADGTGDLTLFTPGAAEDANAIDVVAVLTKIRANCNSGTDKIYSTADFEVQARRNDTRGARSLTLPYFTTVVQGGSAVISKRVGQVILQFADGADRAVVTGQAASYIDTAAARLPEEIVQKITKKRRAGDPDAALDPLADPQVKAALTRSSFEMLVGFQLTEDQLRYNLTR